MKPRTKALTAAASGLVIGVGGLAVLSAPGVVNEGLIVAKFGQVGLAVGTQMTVDFQGDGLIRYAVSGSVRETVKDPFGQSLETAITQASDTGQQFDQGMNREMLRIEFQTADPNIRIIWLVAKSPGPSSTKFDGKFDGNNVENLFIELANGRGLPEVDLTLIAMIAALAAIAGNGGLTLTPPSSGTYEGVSFWQSTSCTAQMRLAGSASGIYHLVAGGQTSWCDYARLVIGEAAALGHPLRVTPEKVLPIPASAYPTPAKRPANSRLDTAKLRSTFGVQLPDWTVHVHRLVRELVDEHVPFEQQRRHGGRDF